MLIECPACHARAKLADSKAGAKVRCGACGRVYVAHPAAAPSAPRPRREAKADTLTGKLLGGTVAVVALMAAFFVTRSRSGDSDEPVQAGGPEVEADEGPKDSLGWDSPVVRAAIALHEAADEGVEALAQRLHGPRIVERVEGEAAAERFVLSSAHERLAVLEEHAQAILDAEDLPVLGWRPYDSEVLELTDDTVSLRLAVSPRDPARGAEKRWLAWQLAREGVAWKAWSWERWLSPAELEELRRRDIKKTQRVELSDGSVVWEREPEPLPHLDDTPDELRARIDRLYATMIDLDLTREASAAQAELSEIGKPAIPILLTGLYEIPLDTEEQAIQCNMIVQTLRRITGQYMGYKPQALVGSGTGTTEERRQSAIKQWFAWWYRNQKRFEKLEVEDDPFAGEEEER